LKNREKCQEKFLGSLKEYLGENGFAKEFESETIYLFAEASIRSKSGRNAYDQSP